MIALIQRVSQASVSVDTELVSVIGKGLLVLLGVEQIDTPTTAERLAAKLLGFRVFADTAGKMNLSVRDVGGALLVVPQFTLVADTGKGKRPSFSRAATPALGESLYQAFVKHLRQVHPAVQTGCFGAHMQVALINDGPVTFSLQI